MTDYWPEDVDYGLRKYAAWLCQSCGDNSEVHVNGKCLFAPTQILVWLRIRPSIEVNRASTYAQIYCCYCRRYSEICARGQTLTSCPACGVAASPRTLWKGEP